MKSRVVVILTFTFYFLIFCLHQMVDASAKSSSLLGMTSGGFGGGPPQNGQGEILAMLGENRRPQQQGGLNLNHLNQGGHHQIPGGGGGASTFNLSDFPSLGRAPAMGGSRTNTQPQQQQAQYGNGDHHHHFRRPEEFNVMDSKDFPALSPFKKGLPSPSGMNQRMPSLSEGTLPPANSTSNSAAERRVQNVHGARNIIAASDMNQQRVAAAQANVNSNVSIERSRNYGLLGLLGIIRMSNVKVDERLLALGQDLTSLGLNLNSSTSLYENFSSPWGSGGDGAAADGGDSNLPACYLQAPSRLKLEHFKEFKPETLFYVFYAMPKDALQNAAAVELYNRSWQYHTELKIWFTAAPGESTGDSPNRYVYFDINAWERRLFSGSIPGGIEAGFLRREALSSLAPPQTLPQAQQQQQQRRS